MLVNGLDGNPHFPQFAPLQGWNLGEEAFQKASLRFLFVFPSPMGLRSVSASHITLYGILKSTFGDDIFVDFWMEPNAYDRSYMEKNFPQKIIGFFSHHTWEDFDIIGVSCAITMMEPLQMIKDLHDAGFPVWYKDRKNDDKTPLLTMGGVAADQTAATDNIVDFSQIGMGERTLPLICKTALEAQAKFGSVAKGKEWITAQVQDHPGIYNPRRYRYDHKIVNGRFESDYLGLVEGDSGSLQMRADTSLPPEVIKMGDNMLRLSLPGGSHHKVSLQSSIGCHGTFGTCSFCAEGWLYGCFTGDTLVTTDHGLVPISKIKIGDRVLTGKGNFKRVLHVHRNGVKDFITVRCMGEEIHTTTNHAWFTKTSSEIEPTFKPIGKSLNCQVYRPRYKFGDKHVNSGLAFLIGLYLSDGTYYHVPLSDGTIKHWGLRVSGMASHEAVYRQKFESLGLELKRVGRVNRSNRDSSNEVEYFFTDELSGSVLQYVTPTEGPTQKDISDDVYLWDEESVLHLLQGFFWGDGAIKIEKNGSSSKVQFLNTNRLLVEKLATLSSGLYASVFTLHQKESRGRKAMYSVRLNAEDSYTFLQTFPEVLSIKNNRALGRRSLGFSSLGRGTGADEFGYYVFLRKKNCSEWGQAEAFDLEVEDDSSYCVGTKRFIVHNSWRERSEEDYRQGIITAKKSAMADGFSWFSFNGNFLENYVQSLQDAAKYFHKIGSINIRIDSLAGSIKLNGENNYIRLLKELGTTSVACPIEGISQRMRDFLNKNLSEDDILTVDEELFKRRMIRVKHGAIFTGYEQKEDWEEHAALTDKELALRDKWNANSMIQYNFTWLVHNAGTPLFYMPRKTTAMAWKQFFAKEDGKDFYYYPYMYLSDRGIKAKESSQPKDTLIQQFLVDCPTEFLEDIWVKPMLRGEMENFSTDQVRRLRQGCEKWGINPRAQLLERDFKKHVHQHMHISTADEVINKFGDGDVLKYLEWIRSTKLNGTGCCLKTPASEWKHNQQKCFGCSSCKTVDEDAKAYGLVKKPHISYMHNRRLQTNYNLMDIKTALMQNTPSFYYRLIFKVTEPGRFIAKEGLVRRWLSKATDYDESLVKNFRCISTALHKWLDYEELTSTYAGYELCIMGFQDQLDLGKFKEIAKQVNAYSKDSGIQLADIQSAQESGGTSFHVLHSFEVIAEKEDFDKFIKKMCTEERRLYEGGTSMPETFAMSIDYKILRGKKGYRVLLLCPPRFNITFGEGLKRWTAPKVFDHIVDWNIMAVFTRTPDGRLIDVLSGHPFEPTGFVHAEQNGNALQDKTDEGISVDGA